LINGDKVLTSAQCDLDSRFMFTFTVRSVQIKKIVAFDRVLLNEVGYKIYS